MAQPDTVAQVVLEQFALLPTRRKPMVRPNGVHEWVPLAGIVAEFADGTLTCLALGTGMKCLPASRLSEARGCALHDWHAEIVAVRSLNRLLLEESRALALGGTSDLLRRRVPEERQWGGGENGGHWHGQPFALRDDLKLWMYCSEAPCGDASMELTMAAQADAAPWPNPSRVAAGDGSEPVLLGRGMFSRLGVVRRKPARVDAPISLSKSCSDKLALKQCTSLLSSVAVLLVAPTLSAYVRGLVLPRPQVCPEACERCFSTRGRMAGVREKGPTWTGGYEFVGLEVLGTDAEFPYSRRSVKERAGDAGLAAVGGATAWNRRGLEESLKAGIICGGRGSTARWASKMSRLKMWELATEIEALLGRKGQEIEATWPGQDSHYGDLKDGDRLSARKKVKADSRETSLAGWIRNEGDSDFGLTHAN